MRTRPLHPLPALALALVASGCVAPALAPIHPMLAGAAASPGEREFAATLGYAPAPGAGLGDSKFPGTPYAEVELRGAVVPRVQLFGGVGVSFQHDIFPWLNSLSAGAKLTAVNEEALAVALAPRVVGASAFNLFNTSSDASRSVFGTRSLGFELPLLFTHRFENDWALTLQVWGRYHLLRQEDATITPVAGSGSSGDTASASAPVETGHVWGAGGALMLSFPKLRGSRARYHVFVGFERLWLTQTSSSGGAAGNLNPLVTLDRNSLVVGMGTTAPW